MRNMRRLARQAANDGSAYCGAFFVCAIFVVMIGGALTRPMGISLSGTDDLVSWMCAAAAFLPMASAFRRGDFVRMLLVLDKLSPKWRRSAEMLALMIALVASAVLAGWATFGVYESWRYDEMRSDCWSFHLDSATVIRDRCHPPADRGHR